VVAATVRGARATAHLRPQLGAERAQAHASRRNGRIAASPRLTSVTATETIDGVPSGYGDVEFTAGRTVHADSCREGERAPLVIAGQRYGPFVMNTRDEIVQAFEDYEAGRMGRIERA
jgi:hypothetical protein